MGDLLMSEKERDRLEVLGRVGRKELTVVAAAGLLGLSERQMRRVWKRFGSAGAAGLLHGLRGRASNRRLDADLAERVVKRHQERYGDFGPTLACEKLAAEGLTVSPHTLCRLLKERGLWQRRRKRKQHRRRRERRSWFGSLLQMDGSHHDWFEGRGPGCVLMVLIDDATSRCFARFYAAEDLSAAFDAFGRWAGLHGLPRALYVDRHSIYRNPDKPQVPTQFARAMTELGVELICAHSPQAKGRVERRNAVFQDRLVKEMRLRNISTIGQANALLERVFLKDLNQRYAISAAKQADLHRPAPADLEQVLCVQEKRMVGQDWCVRWQNRWLQIDRRHASLNLAGREVTIRALVTGQLLVQHDGQTLRVQELPARPKPAKARKPIVNNRRYKPPATHPWKNDPARRAAPPVPPAPAAPARGAQAERRQHRVTLLLALKG
jgi:transposase